MPYWLLVAQTSSWRPIVVESEPTAILPYTDEILYNENGPLFMGPKIRQQFLYIDPSGRGSLS